MVMNRPSKRQNSFLRLDEELVIDRLSNHKQAVGEAEKAKLSTTKIYAVVAQLVEQLHGESHDLAHPGGNFAMHPE